MKFNIPNDLNDVRNAFTKSAFDIRFVGGCVRDEKPKDFDLCTDATPEEQIKIYKDLNLRIIETETAIVHGTVSIVLGSGVYEVTSLRTDANHDGRHATVSYTKDWEADAGRRDLTINAMAMTFDGTIIDYFGGVADLNNKIVRFVGNAEQRMREDYLRILRWIRFHGRIADGQPLNEEAFEASVKCGEGLKNISRERVWAEVSKIISGNNGPGMIDALLSMGLAPYIDLPEGNIARLFAVARVTNDPVTLMVAFVDNYDAVMKLSIDWKWRRADIIRAEFLAKRKDMSNPDFRRMLAAEGRDRDNVIALYKLLLIAEDKIADWEIPVFPVTGGDLIRKGMKPGKELGRELDRLKAVWADGDYTKTTKDLLG